MGPRRSDEWIPVSVGTTDSDSTVIVGRGLDLVERITGRRTYWTAAGGGAGTGAVVGALLGVAAHAMTGGRRDFSSSPRFRAKSYDLLVDNEVADQAVQVLRGEGGPGIGHRPE